MNKKILTTAVVAFLLMSTDLNAQYREIAEKELETHVFQNHQSNKPGFQDLFTQMIIEVEDFNLLSTHFAELQASFSSVFHTEKFELDPVNQRLVVVFDRTLAKTDDFLKVFKETMLKKGVLMYLYEEKVLVRSL